MLPLFIALGIVRLLVVALPDVVASPIFFVHAFYQLLLGAILVLLAARWRYGGQSAIGHALLGVIAGVLFVQLLGPFYTRVVVALAGAPRDDPQGAIALLPAFQVGLYLALWVAAFIPTGWKRFLIGLAALELTPSGWLARAAHRDHLLRLGGACARHPRLGDRRPALDSCRRGQRWPDASLKSSRSRPLPRSSPR